METVIRMSTSGWGMGNGRRGEGEERQTAVDGKREGSDVDSTRRRCNHCLSELIPPRCTAGSNVITMGRFAVGDCQYGDGEQSTVAPHQQATSITICPPHHCTSLLIPSLLHQD